MTQTGDVRLSREAASGKRWMSPFLGPFLGDLRPALLAVVIFSGLSLFCAATSADGMAKLRDAYHGAADAWSSIEMIHYGPIAEDFRGERLSFWPERKNAVEKALKNILAKPGCFSASAKTASSTTCRPSAALTPSPCELVTWKWTRASEPGL